MQLKISVKRLLSNIVDLTCFFICYIILNLTAGLDSNITASVYFIFVSFIICFIIPLVVFSNTIGKLIFNLHWNQQKEKKHLIIIKYVIYYLSVAPEFSIISFIANIPFLKMSNYSVLSLQISASILVVDLIIFIFSLGKYHLLDYMFNLQIIGLSFKKTPLKSLSIHLLFWWFFIVINLAFIKWDLSVKGINDAIIEDVYFENFPDDLYYGNKPFVVKKKSDNVFIPSDMLSLLFDKEYDEKIIFLYLPFEIFNDKNERFQICKDLILQSIINDVFLDYKPKQTKVVLKTDKNGKFLEYYNYSYTYYFCKDAINWGIYGGIENDSSTIYKYINFINEVKNAQPVESRIIPIESSLSSNQLKIIANKAELIFNRVDFNDVKVRANMQLNFPPQRVLYRHNYWNIVGAELPILDDDTFFLKNARDEVSTKYF